MWVKIQIHILVFGTHASFASLPLAPLEQSPVVRGAERRGRRGARAGGNVPPPIITFHGMTDARLIVGIGDQPKKKRLLGDLAERPAIRKWGKCH